METNNNKFKNLRLLKKKILERKKLVGGWLQISSPDIAEIVSANNFDWVCVDLEHGSNTISNLPNMIRAVEINDKVCFVRVPSKNNHETITKVLDMGALALIIPKIENIEDVEKLKSLINYPPSGKRGVGYCRANLYSKNYNSYFKAQKNKIVIGMIESQEGVKNLDKILKLKFLDGVFVGPMDLKNSINPSLNFKSTLFLKQLSYVIKLCKKYKISCGIHILEKNYKKNKNFNFNAYMTDAMALTNYKIKIRKN